MTHGRTDGRTAGQTDMMECWCQHGDKYFSVCLPSCYICFLFSLFVSISNKPMAFWQMLLQSNLRSKKIPTNVIREWQEGLFWCRKISVLNTTTSPLFVCWVYTLKAGCFMLQRYKADITQSSRSRVWPTRIRAMQGSNRSVASNLQHSHPRFSNSG